jgi:hypothetical protein
MADDNNLAAGVAAEPTGVAAPAASNDGQSINAGDANLVQQAADAAAAAIKKAEGDPAVPAAGVAPAPAATVQPTIEDYKIDLGKNAEGVDLNTLDDGGALDRFKEFSIGNNISPEAAQKLIEHQQEEMRQATQEMIAAGEVTLKGKWGNSYEPNKATGFVALAQLDRKMGGRLSKSFSQSGAINDPVVIEALYEIGQMIGEDNLGAGGPGGAPEGEMTTEEAYKAEYAKAGKRG